MRNVVEESLGKVSGLVGEERVKVRSLFSFFGSFELTCASQVVKELYAELEKVSKSGKSTEDMTKEAKKLVEAKVGSLGDLKDKAVDAASDAEKKDKDAVGGSGGTLASLAASVPGLGGLGKVRFLRLPPRIELTINADSGRERPQALARPRREARREGREAPRVHVRGFVLFLGLIPHALTTDPAEIKQVLAKKVEEAKKVAGDAAGDAKKQTSK